ncbi:MAG: 1,4-dihydroxy-2-naphthoate octaprenyltransferase [Verrucomicrobia bacterium RIFCSPLOWO2_12_FULL_64_8]|nr:MAG: 1,4-dihydroxy-2-naphthoate octaprenyltransferase [Verrucomicrobia bacterium RIFCSPLOWO2_12_FULL_64_8]
MTSVEPRWRIWLAAARPRTLPAAVAPVVVGSAFAWQAGAFDGRPAGICLAFALLVQIGTNFANDYYDFLKGADNAARVGPRRAVASGLMAPAAMRRAMILAFGLAFLVGLSLVAWGGWWLVVIGVASIVSGIAYTGGPWPLGYLGLGDLFVFVFFGLVAVGATFYVQAGYVSHDVLYAAAAIGALTANILVVNNYRDAGTDAAAGKRTLVVRFGKTSARAQFVLAHGLAAAVIGLLAWRGFFPRAVGIAVAAGFFAGGLAQWRVLHSAQTAAELVRLLGRCGVWLAVYAAVLSALVVAG